MYNGMKKKSRKESRLRVLRYVLRLLSFSRGLFYVPASSDNPAAPGDKSAVQLALALPSFLRFHYAKIAELRTIAPLS
jgi:hypothetical protein